jgi:hypothetical protein
MFLCYPVRDSEEDEEPATVPLDNHSVSVRGLRRDGYEHLYMKPPNLRPYDRSAEARNGCLYSITLRTKVVTIFENCAGYTPHPPSAGTLHPTMFQVLSLSTDMTRV